MKLQIGDEVIITSGKDKGKRGKIEKVFPKKSRILLPGFNLYKKHQKAASGQTGGVIEKPRPLPFSNVALICPNCNKQTRIGYKTLKTGDKVRICAKCKAQLPEESKK